MATIFKHANCAAIAVGLVVFSIQAASADPIDDAFGQRKDGALYVPIRSISVHPWFGTGLQDWRSLYSEFVDRPIGHRKGGNYESVAGYTISQLMLAVMAKRANDKKKSDGVAPPQEDPDILKLRKEVADLKDAIANEKDGARLAQLRRDLMGKQKDLLVAEGAKPSPQDVPGRLLDLLDIKKYALRDDLLASDSVPRLSDLPLFPGFLKIKISQRNCLQVDEAKVPASGLDDMSAEGDVAQTSVVRPWLVGPLLDTKTPLAIEGGISDAVASAAKKYDVVYRISGLVVAREVRLSGSVPGDFYKRVTDAQLPAETMFSGCVAAFATSGIGFDHPLSLPLPGPSGFVNPIPQVLGFMLLPLPSMTAR